jgi:hypothetical protein
MARLDTRTVAEGIPEEWLANDEVAPLQEPEYETPEMREWRMIVAFLANC